MELAGHLPRHVRDTMSTSEGSDRLGSDTRAERIAHLVHLRAPGPEARGDEDGQHAEAQGDGEEPERTLWTPRPLTPLPDDDVEDLQGDDRDDEDPGVLLRPAAHQGVERRADDDDRANGDDRVGHPDLPAAIGEDEEAVPEEGEDREQIGAQRLGANRAPEDSTPGHARILCVR